jgi:integrase
MAWIRKARNGRGYHVHYRDAEGIEHSQTYRLMEDARTFKSSIEVDLARGAYRDPALGRIALAAFWPMFMEASPHLAPKTRQWYEMMARRHILPALGSKRLVGISRLDVEAFLSGLRARRVGEPTIAGAYRVLRAVLAKAEMDGRILASPCRGVRMPRPADKEQRVLTMEELEAIADAVPDRYRALVLVLGYCGLRIGEAAALRVSDADFLRRVIVVARAQAEVGSRLVVGPTKTRRSRVVDVPASVIEELAHHVGAFPPGLNGLLFTNRLGEPIRQSNFSRKVWGPALIRAGIAEPLPRVHDLRHTASALSVAVGAHPKEVQSLLGHASIGMTLDTYGHLFAGASRALAERLEQARMAALTPSGAEQMRNSGGTGKGRPS